jgi:protein-S-isoprenylcysteine O-methyltransferase Ste14
MPEGALKSVFLVGFVAGLVIRKVWTTRVARHGQKGASTVTSARPDRLEWVLMILITVGMFALPVVCLATPWLDFADYRLPDWATVTSGVVGTAVFALALWLLWRSHADLGRHWSVRLEIQQDHSLVTDGVYRHIRHPMYAAHWLWAMAQLLLLPNWIAGPAFLVSFLPLYLRRVPREEQMLLDYFGEQYRTYVSRTGRVIPRLRSS